MAGYFTVDNSFWTDSNILDEFTPEDKYFYLYVLTCPYANISGCYEISLKQIAYDTGYSKETVERLIDRFINVHKVVDFDAENKELLVCNWGKYHWTKSEKYLKALDKRISSVKTERFRKYLLASKEAFGNSDDENTVWIRYQYSMDTSFTYTYTLPFNISSSNNGNRGVGEEETAKEGSKAEKKKAGDPFVVLAEDDDALLEALRSFEDMRNRMKKPMVGKSKSLLVGKLKKFDRRDWIPIIEQSILHGWDSVYPLKEDWGRDKRVGKNRHSGHGKSGQDDRGAEQKYGDLQFIDPDNELTWGT